MQAVGWVDIGLAAFLLLSIVFGLVRGFVFELLSAAGWVVAFFAAPELTPHVLHHVQVAAAGSTLNRMLAFAAAFVVVLVAWSLAARLVRLLIRATPLSPIDRLLGAGFGALRGVAVLLLLAALVSATPLRHAPAWQRSDGAAWLNAALQGIRPWLPVDWTRRVAA